MGPVEMLVLKFPGNQFKGEIIPALSELVESNTIRIIDAVFVHKGPDAAITVLEISDLSDDDKGVFDALVSDITGLLSESDIQALSELIFVNSSAAMLLFENVWASKFAEAVRNANGEVVLSERIPRTVVEAELASISASA